METIKQQETAAILAVFEAVKALEIQLAAAQERIRQLEAIINFSEFKMNKDIA
jgi:hypothetical protein